MITKKCVICKEVRDIDLFAKDRSRKDGHQRECKFCRQSRYKNGIDNDRDVTYKRIFGIDLNTYNEMLKKQAEKCLICKRHQSEVKKRFAVDHCHTTGKIRALLCEDCNLSLGRLRENTEIMLSMIKYVEEIVLPILKSS